MWLTTLSVGLVLSVVSAAHHKHHHRQPIIQLNGAEEFLGSLREDERVLAISPHLSVYPDTGPICSYVLTSIAGDETPFEVEILDKHQGTAIVRVRDGAAPIDCSHNEYNLRVVAVSCSDIRSEPAILKISVKDTNNHAPEFDAPWYSFDVEEGKLESNIAHLYTTDKDCGHPYGKICRYEITNALDGFPFRIDDQGVISTTRPLNRSDSESHILTVVAYDCGMQRSKSTLVTINVRRSCTEGLRGTPAVETGIQYTPATGSRVLMPEAELIVCPTEKKCEVKSATTELKLDVERNGEHDSVSTQKCGMNIKTLDLLPRPKSSIEERNVVVGTDGKEKELLLNSVENLTKDVGITTSTKTSKVDEGEEEDDDDDGEDENDEDLSGEDQTTKPTERYVFDGKSNAVIVPSTTIKQVIPQRFTLAFSMKHARGSKEEQSQKQNILCETDDFNMNRHHFSVYIRHCKLELLLRREAAQASAEFRAAEWRFDAPEVCDDQWHSYAILFHDIDNVQLLIDGRKFTTTDRNPEILDDWPLHETKELKTRLVVGGCWHGRSQSMTQFFKGHLSSMYLLLGEVETETAIECLHQPTERLRFDAMEQLVPGESATFTEDQTRLTLTANTIEDLSLLLQKVEYVNTNAVTNPGKRTLTVSSNVECKGIAKRSLGVYETSVQVKKAEDPILSISGQNMINTDRHSMKVGTIMLPDIQITITQSVGGKDEDVTEKYNLDNCKLHLRPSRDMDLEYFSSPAALIASLNVDFEHDAQGILLKGEESVHGYREVLSKIHYFNTRPESYSKRMYTLQCSMNQGKILSNEFFVTMNIDSEMTEAIEKLERASQKLDIDENDLIKRFEPSAFDQLGANRLQNILEMDLPRPKALLSHHGYEMGQGAVAGGAIAVIVVICVGFLLVLLVVGVLKMRDTPMPRRRRQRKNTTVQEGMEPEWDDSGMNITVNPLEDVEKQQQPAVAYSETEDESSDDGESYHDDEEFSDEEEERAPALPQSANGGLEWDDLAGSNLSRTYRV